MITDGEVICSAYSHRLGDSHLEESRSYLKCEVPGPIRNEFEIVRLADGDRLDGRAHLSLGGGQGPSIFADCAPLDGLRIFVEEGDAGVGVVGAHVDETE